MHETTYHRPSTVDEAAALFAKGSDSKYLAGGHTLLPVMKARLASPSDVIDLAKIKDLVGIQSVGRCADHQGGDHLFRHHEQRRGEEQHSRAGASHVGARRSGGALSRHHRRLHRQQRSGGGLSRRRARAQRHGDDQQAHRSRPTISSRACFRPRSRTARSLPRSPSRSRPRRAIRKCAIRRRASR